MLGIERCVIAEENNLAWYVKKSTEPMLEMVKIHGNLNIEGAIESKQLKKHIQHELATEWSGKRLHGQFVRVTENVKWSDAWWVAKKRRFEGDNKSFDL